MHAVNAAIPIRYILFMVFFCFYPKRTRGFSGMVRARNLVIGVSIHNVLCGGVLEE
jgi:hypothetical protein